MEDRQPQDPAIIREIAPEGAFDPDSETSLLNILPPAAQDALLRSKNFYLQDLSAESIRKNIQHTKEYQTLKDLRQSFWLEYTRAVDAGRKMQMTRVWQGIVYSSGEFYNLLKKEHFAAFLFTRPIKQEVRERELLEIATKRMANILEAEPFNKDGSLNPFVAKVQIDLFKHLDERVQGGIIKQSSTRALNVTYNENKNTVVHQTPDIKRMEDLQAKLLELREKTKHLPQVAIPDAIVIDVEDEPAPRD